jgi:hypothetical protein
MNLFIKINKPIDVDTYVIIFTGYMNLFPTFLIAKISKTVIPNNIPEEVRRISGIWSSEYSFRITKIKSEISR